MSDWWEKSPTRDSTKMQSLLTQAIKGAQTAKSAFLRLRYGFQAVRLAHYSGDYQQAVALYDQLIQPLSNPPDPMVSQSKVPWWTLALKAGALQRLDKRGKSLYQFSRAFMNDAENRNLYLQNFKLNGDADWRAALQLATTPEEQSALWFLRGAKNAALELLPLQEIYKLSPQSPLLTILLLREVNKVERQLLTPAFVRGDSTVIKQIYADNDYSLLGEIKSYEEMAVDGGMNANEMPNTPSAPEVTEPANRSFWQRVGGFFSNLWSGITGVFRSEKTEAPATITSDNPKLDNEAYIRSLQEFVDKGVEEKKVADVTHLANRFGLSFLFVATIQRSIESGSSGGGGCQCRPAREATSGVGGCVEPLGHHQFD